MCGREFTKQEAAGESSTLKSFAGCESWRLGIFHHSCLQILSSSARLDGTIFRSRDAGLGSTLTGPLQDIPDLFCRDSVSSENVASTQSEVFFYSRGPATVLFHMFLESFGHPQASLGRSFRLLEPSLIS